MSETNTATKDLVETQLENLKTILQADWFVMDMFVGKVKELIEALPKCDLHPENPATKAHRRGSNRFCDLCGEGVPDYPRAQPLRDVLALITELEKKD